MLEQTQIAFLAALRGAPSAVGLGESEVPHGVSWQVYRRNYQENHVEALSTTYSSVRETVGAAFFRQLATQYVRAFDSRSGDLNDYGAEFATFVQASEACAGLPYLADLARLDWAWLQVLRAPSIPTDWLSALLAAPVDRQGVTRVSSAARCITSAYPIYAIWQLATEGGDQVDLDQAGQTVLVSRTASVEVTHLAPAAARFTQCWLAGSTLELALEDALALDPALDIAALLAQLSALGAIESLESES